VSPGRYAAMPKLAVTACTLGESDGVQRQTYPLQRRLGIVEARLRQQDDELFAAPAPEEIGGAQMQSRYLRHFLQHLIADQMPMGVIQTLEVVQIEQTDAELLPIPFRQSDQVVHIFVQATTVGQAGQRIGIGEIRHNLVFGVETLDMRTVHRQDDQKHQQCTSHQIGSEDMFTILAVDAGHVPGHDLHYDNRKGQTIHASGNQCATPQIIEVNRQHADNQQKPDVVANRVKKEIVEMLAQQRRNDAVEDK
jgi:hypothetical protein